MKEKIWGSKLGIRVLCVILGAFLLEMITLLFTDNKMYTCPEQAESILDGIYAINGESVEKITSIENQEGSKGLVFKNDKGEIQTLFLQFEHGGDIENICCYYPNEQGQYTEENIVVITGIGRNRASLIKLPKGNYSEIQIVISGQFVLKDVLVSKEEPLIVPVRVMNYFRIIIYAVFLFLALQYKKTIIRACQYFRRREFWEKFLKILLFLIIVAGVITGTGVGALKALEKEVYRYHYIYFCFTGLILGIFLLYIQKVISKVENLFLFVTMLFVVLYTNVMPVYVIGGDSAVHLRRALDMAQEYGDSEYRAYKGILEEENKVLVSNVEEVIEVANSDTISNYTSIKWPEKISTRFVAYIPFAAGFVIADALNCSAHVAFLMGEICNGWFCTFLMYLAARKLKSGKMILIFFASLPNIIRLMCIYSYTPWVVCWITFASAYIIGELQTPERKMTKKDFAVIIGALLMGIAPKAPYFLIMLLTFMIPKEKFENEKSRKYFFLTVFVGMCILVMTLVVPALFSNSGFDIYSDRRGGENVDAVGQLKFIMGDIGNYVVILLKNIKSICSPSNFIYSTDGFTALRNGKTILVPSIVTLLFIIIIITDRKKMCEYYLSTQKRFFVFGITFLNICCICTVLYMNYSEVGSAVMKGINPLYLLTFMFPFFYYCSSEKVRSCFIWRRYNTILYGGYMAILLVSVFALIVNVYY